MRLIEFFEATVYHGSPHKFDRFDVSFMGSGEGNQTYGWGIYFAEHPEVAQSYQQMGDRWAEWRGQKILYPWHRNSDDMPSEISIAGTALAQANGDPEEARHMMAKYMYSDYRQMPKLFGRVFKNLPELAKQIEVKSTQNFYTVEIPDQVIARMLLWDYTLDHQPPNVQKVIRTAIQEFGIQHKEGVTDGWAYYDRIGQALSNNPSEQHKAASEYLNQRGVPGQRYLDQESRSQGEGTHNIVLFDPRHAKILDRRTPVGEALTEGATPVLYHYTHTGNLGKILANNEFSLATSLGTGAESPHDVKGAPYYLSTTRSKTGAYHQSPGNYSAMLVLDGQALAQNYKVKPVDYWGQGFGQSEDEDRVYSREQTIPNASKYIKEIHILTEMKDFPGFSGDQTRRGLRKALIDGKKLGVPMYLYRDRKAWILQDKRKALPVSQALDKPQEPEKRWPSMKKTNWFKPWLELYYQNTAEKLSQDATRLLKNLRYDDYNGQVTRRLLNDVHNDKRSPNVAALVKVMKKHRLNTVADYTGLLKQKWGIEQ